MEIITSPSSRSAEAASTVITYSMETNPDFIAVLPTNNPTRFIVAVMTFHAHDDEYVIKKCSHGMKRQAADALAKSWAGAIGVEIR
jgi:hypothetical protein